MSEISRVALFGKLNPIAYKAIEGATVFCKMRGNPYVELVHWLVQIVQNNTTDLDAILRHYQIDAAALAKDMTAALDRLPRGSTAISDFSEHIENGIERGWVYGTLMFGQTQVRTGYLMLGLLKTNSLRNALLSISRQFERIKADDLAENFAKVCGASAEANLGAQDGSALDGGQPGEDTGAIAPAAMGKQEALKKFTVDMTARAQGRQDGPGDGSRRGDPPDRRHPDAAAPEQPDPDRRGRRRQDRGGRGLRAAPGARRRATAAEGGIAALARPRPAAGRCQHEGRVRAAPAPGHRRGPGEPEADHPVHRRSAHAGRCGGAAGTGDAANLLKPALARGNLRTIRRDDLGRVQEVHRERPALTRRFQVVQVPEPDEQKAILMLRGVATVLEKHHRAQLLDEAIEAAVKLSHRYIPARQLPDKAVSLLDTACARVAVSQHATPADVEDCRRRIESLEIESGIVDREAAVGVAIGDRGTEVAAKLASERERLGVLEARWKEEKTIVDRILALRATLRGDDQPVDGAVPAGEPDRAALLSELAVEQDKLAALQGDAPLIMPSVDAQAVASVVADWTGIPVGRMVKNELETILRLGESLGQRVIGQQHGLDMIARRIQTARARLDNPNKPIGVFMLCGTSGVGKTETALALAEALYGGEQNVITINMSEFQEAHTVSTLKGSPPGYIGYGEGGILTEAVRRRPVQRGAARRGREGPLRRARAVLPGLRQGSHGRRRGPDDRLQEHDHPAHLERRVGADHEHVQGP
jgi:type VI secretion system protein VasG